MHLLVVAKSPVPGKVKTRLVPPLSYEQAAALAEASLAQTLEAAAGCAADRKLLALDGEPGGWIPPGFVVFPQVEGSLGDRLAAAWSASGGPGIQIGMDTPQVTSILLDMCLTELEQSKSTAALGLAHDGGWWALGLRQRWAENVFSRVPMSTSDTGRLQIESLEAAGHTVLRFPTLRDVDTVADAAAVAADVPDSRFARAWSATGQPG
jgi:glycosyltransferase A (GT-A) superfamily protein (DUF2064 family)